MLSPKDSPPQIFPINCLPLELLAQVFLCMLPVVHSANDVQPPSIREAPLNISHVCRCWRSLALSIRQLWTQVYFDINDYSSFERMKAAATAVISFMERSADHPLAIRVQGLQYVPSSLSRRFPITKLKKLGKSLSLPNALIRAQPRWYLVNIRIPAAIWQSGYKENDKWEMGKCGLLEELHFQLFKSSPTTPLQDDYEKLFSVDLTSCTRIRRVLLGDLNCKLIDGTFPTFSQLTSFYIPYTSFFSMEVIFKVLACAPFLEDLQLKVSFVDFKSGLDATPVHLPRLRKLHVAGADGWQPQTSPHAFEGDPVNILDRLEAPALKYLNLSAGDVDSYSAVRSMIRLLQRSSASLTTLILECYEIGKNLLRLCLTYVPHLERLWFSPRLFQPDYLFRILTVSETCSKDAVLCPLLSTLTVQCPISSCDMECISRLLLSRSPPDAEMYQRAHTVFPEGGAAQKGRHGTSALRSFNFASVCNGDICNFNNDVVYQSEDSEHELWFIEDDAIASLVGRGLKVNVRDCGD